MTENIWDAFGRWDEFAQLDDINGIKHAISAARLWLPNFVSPQQTYIFEYVVKEALSANDLAIPTIIDFGCGLGRNGRMLKEHFPRVVGFDLADMLAKLKSYSPDAVESVYSALYSVADELVTKEAFCALYDSVALQHIVDEGFISNFIDKLMSNPRFRTIVSVYFKAENRARYLDVLAERGWSIWHSEEETLSFEGTAHRVCVFRRW